MSMTVLVLQAQADGDAEAAALEITPRNVLSWEKTFPRRSMALLSDGSTKVEYLYEIAWIALGKPGDDFGDFCAKTDVAYGPAKKAASADVVPTNVAASTEPSPS